MPEEAGDIHLTIVVLKATGLTSKSALPMRSKPNGYVTIKWVKKGQEPQEHQTKVVERTTSPEWNETVNLVYLSKNSTITFEMFDKGLAHRHSYGVVRKTVAELLAAPRLAIPFLPHEAVLSITVKAQDTDSAASDNLRVAQNAILELAEAPDTPEITVSCYAPLEEVVASLDKFIHPLVKIAWSVVSVVYAVVKHQVERNKAVHELLKTMATLYEDSVLLKVAQKELSDNIVKTFKQILQQTIECSLFIQEYSGKGFAPGQAIASSLSTTVDQKIADFKDAFIGLRRSLDTGLSVQIALVSIRIAREVDGLAVAVNNLARRVDMPVLKSKLEPATIEWTDRPTCHPRTRLDVQGEITKWIVDSNGTNVLWLIGHVGAGKSTLATTIASTYAGTRRLGAFVFFNRDVEERRNPTKFVRTLAYELCKFDQCISEKISSAIDDRPHITQELLDDQFQHLIHGPLQDAVSEGSPLSFQGPILIVIDALDECGDKYTRRRLLKVLAKETANLPSFVRIIITSRDELDIRMAFNDEEHIKQHKLEVSPDDTDIRVYTESKLKEVAKVNYLGESWPDTDKHTRLVSLAGGLFIWASTACKYIDGEYPKIALDQLLQLKGEGVHKDLDGLYNKALQNAGNWAVSRLEEEFQAIVGTISVVKSPMTSMTIDDFLGLEPLSSQRFLSRFTSVICQMPNEPVRVFHKSFNDFIIDPGRCTNPAWFINISHHECCVALNCIARMKKEFKTLRHFAPSITPKVDYDEAVKYSCSYWIHHVVAVREDPERTKVAKVVYDFMKDHILHWMEARSILGTSRSTPTMLEQLYQWAPSEGMDDLKSLAYDTYRFAVSFTETIAKHPAMVAQVALPFAPLMSKLYQLFHNPDELPTVMGGYQRNWPSLLRTFTPSMHIDYVLSVTFSPDMSNIAAVYRPWNKQGNNCVVQCWEMFSGIEAFPGIELQFASITQFSADGTQIWIASEDGSLYVLDAVTGDQLSKLPWDIWMKVSPRPTFCRASLSSDGQWAIFGNSSGQLYVIDRKERKLAYDILDICSRLEHDWTRRLTMLPSIVFSLDDKMFAAGSGDGNIYVWQTNTGNKLHTLEGHEEEPVALAFSSEGGKLYSISDDGNVRIWSFTTTGHRSESSITIGGMPWRECVKTLSADGHIASACKGVSEEPIRIWDATTGEEVGPVLEHSSFRMTAMSFSRDERTLVSGDDHIRTWNVSGFGRINDVNSYSLYRLGCNEVAFSPSGLIVRSTGFGEVKFWSSVTGRQLSLGMEPSYCNESINFIARIDVGASENKEVRRKIQVNKEKFHDAPDTIMTPFGEIVSFENPQFHSELSEVERGWEAKIKVSNPENLTWTQSDSRIIYSHPKSVSNKVGAVRYDQEIWRPPLEFEEFCCDLRPNFIALVLNTDRKPIKIGRIIIVHIPESLVVRNTQPV
ncbi:hypothetical protein EYR36_012013 [Pleurotus pulmonarius]|nr:hypothetical protein EYR36_012013 [Pleurotus pulmonarius]